MLAAIRSFAKSWVVKILLGLLVVSFAIWGIGDVFTGGRSDVVARVGEHDITATELDEAFRRRLQQLQRQSPQPLGRADAIRFGLLEDTLMTLAAQRLLDAEAERLRLTTADATVARLIVAEPAFHVDGAFDRQRFEALLRQSGLDERSYTEELRSERTRDALVGALRPIGNLPESLTTPLAQRIGEARSGRLLLATAADGASLPAPDDATLQSHLEANASRFEAPERRDLTAVLLGPDLLAAAATVDDVAVAEAYAAAGDRFAVPEARTVRQLRGDDETALRDAYTALRNGETAEAVAARLDGVAMSTLGSVAEASLPEAFAAPIFSAPGAGSVTPPVQSAFGWHVFLVDAVIPATIRPLAEVRDELRAELARQRAVDELPALRVALDDAIGSGTALEQAAADLALPLVRAVGVDRAGRDPGGTPVADLQRWEPMLVEAFAANEGEVSLLEEIDADRAFVVRVDAVEPAHPQSLAEARAAVLADWRAAEAKRLARERAEAALARLQAGDAIDATIAAFGLVEQAIPRQTRAETGIAPAVGEALFATTPGAIAQTVVDTNDGVAVVVVDAETVQDEATVLATLEEVERGFARDLLVQYEAALRQRHPLAVDRRALARFFPVE